MFDLNILRVKKKTLFLFAGLLWSFAGWRVFSIGETDLFRSTFFPFHFLPAALFVFSFFTFIVFGKILKKHEARVMKSPLSRHCAFSFFDWKGYLMMIFMIGGGIFLRNAAIFPSAWIGTFYIGLGAALLFAGIRFMSLHFRFPMLMTRYNLSDPSES